MQVKANRENTQFIRRLTESQAPLFAYIFVLIGDREAARDVLQETNVYLWNNADRYDLSTPFLAWAKTMAKFQVKKYRLYAQREGRKLLFDDAVCQAAAEHLEASPESDSERPLAAMEHCLSLLGQPDRELLSARYIHRESVRRVAERLCVSEPSLRERVYRLRKGLYNCIQRKLCEWEDRP